MALMANEAMRDNWATGATGWAQNERIFDAVIDAVECAVLTGHIGERFDATVVDENEHVLERFTLLDADTILYEATVTDPTVFAKPVEMRFTLKRVPAEQQILEYSCLEGERSLQHYTDEDGGRKIEVHGAPASTRLLPLLSRG